MKVTVRLIGALRIDRFKEQQFELPVGTTPAEIIEQISVSQRALGILLINGVHAQTTDQLQDGDTLAMLPILGGG